MNVTVYFATNRVVSNAGDAARGYERAMVPPLRPDQMTYGTAFISGIDIAGNAQGVVSQIADVSRGDFSPSARGDLENSGRNILVFVHGFDNTFSDAVTRAGFNAAWFAASGNPAADMTVVAFSWPSMGKLINGPILPDAYWQDQHMAALSGLALMDFLSRMAAIIGKARAARPGQKSVLLAHSMGNLALQSAVEQWFANGNGTDMVFDQAILAAGDCPYDAFNLPEQARLSGLRKLASRISTYYSHVDQVLQLSMAVNLGAKRLGQDGALHRSDPLAFPPAIYGVTDCTAVNDYASGFLNSHQYYRESPAIRELIAGSI